jgi:fatty-acid desaturase
MVAVINSILAGVFAGMLAAFAAALPLYAAAGIGAAVLATSVIAHRRYQINKYAEFEIRLETLFPAGAK